MIQTVPPEYQGGGDEVFRVDLKSNAIVWLGAANIKIELSVISHATEIQKAGFLFNDCLSGLLLLQKVRNLGRAVIKADVREIGHSAEHGSARRQERRRDLRQRSVLGAGDLHLAGQRLSPGDLDRVHLPSFPQHVAVEARQVALDADLREPCVPQHPRNRLALRRVDLGHEQSAGR